MYILGKRLLSLSIIKKVSFMIQEVKSNACSYFKIMEEGINSIFYA